MAETVLAPDTSAFPQTTLATGAGRQRLVEERH
jgi:hypothetical protein